MLDTIQKPTAMLLAMVLLASLAPLSFDISAVTLVVPVTLQSLLVILTGICLGPWRGGIVIGLYLVLGALGAPIFADYKSGPEVFSSPSSGFLLGFIPTAILSGWLSERHKSKTFHGYIAIFLVAQCLLLCLGAIGLIIYGLPIIRVANILVSLLPGLVIKSILGSLIVIGLDRLVRGYARRQGSKAPMTGED